MTNHSNESKKRLSLIKWLKKYTDEIQTACSIISTVFIGVLGLWLTIQSNQIAEKQLDITLNAYNPVITYDIERNVETGMDTITLYNNGNAIKNPRVEIISYYNFSCNENKLGCIPIRAYIINDEISYETYASSVGEIAQICFCNVHHPTVQEATNIRAITRQYTEGYWNMEYTHIIKIMCTDSINNEHEQFFVCDQQGIRVLSAEKANNVIAEKEKTIDNKDGSFSSVEKFFLFESSNTESIFKYALKKIRDKNLYFDDQNEIVKYGEYEPK